MIACDWCSKKKEGKWTVFIRKLAEEKLQTPYLPSSGGEATDVTLCDMHYEPIRAIMVKGGEM